jgi:hypothetical protein
LNFRFNEIFKEPLVFAGLFFHDHDIIKKGPYATSAMAYKHGVQKYCQGLCSGRLEADQGKLLHECTSSAPSQHAFSGMAHDIIERRQKNSGRRHTNLNYAEWAARLCSLAEQLKRALHWRSWATEKTCSKILGERPVPTASP